MKTAGMKSAEVAIVTLARFISVPLFLHAWTPELYGEWLILTSVLVYFSMGDLGFGQAAANEMTMAVARGDRDNATKTYHTTAAFFVVVSVVAVLLPCLLVQVLPLGSWLNLSSIKGTELHVVVFLLTGCLALSFFRWLLLAAYRCDGLYHRGLAFVNLFLLVDLAGTAGALLAGGGTIIVATVMLGARLLVLCLMIADLRRMVPWLKLGLTRSSWSVFRGMLSPSLSFLSFPLGTELVNQGIVIAIGTLVGPASVVVFSAMRTLTNTVVRLFELVNQAFYPEVAMAWGAGNADLVARLHRASCRASLWLGVLAIVLMVLTGRWVFDLWTGGKVEFDGVLLYGLLAVVGIQGAWYTSYVLPSSINRHQGIAVASLLLSAAALAAFVYVLHVAGPHWALIALGALEAARIVVVLPVSLRLARESLGGFVREVLTPPNPLDVVRVFARKRVANRRA